jgi:rhamnosyltransferase subunit B
MRILICTIGTGGDVNPYIAVGAELQRRGHEVTLLLNPHFQKRAEAVGLDVVPLGTEEEYLEVVKGRELVHATRGPVFVIRTLITGPAPAMFETTRRLIRERKIDVVLRHFIAFAAGWGAAAENTPTAVGVLTPLFWFARSDPSSLRKPWIADPPPWMSRLQMRITRYIGCFIYDPPVNRCRAELGLPPVRDVLKHEFLGGDLNLGLWSPLYRDRRPDDPPHGRICGFTWFDQQDAQSHLDPEMERFLGQGEPPIIFTLGTSVVHHAGDFYTIAAEACRRIGRRALLLTGSPDNQSLAASLPPGVRAFGYAPFSPLLPRGAATVHHGGIGTTAQAMRSGKPMVTIPFANDEFDNALRARRLGVSRTLDLNRLSSKTLGATLQSLLDDPQATTQASRLRPALLAENGAVRAADELERHFAARGASSSVLQNTA